MAEEKTRHRNEVTLVGRLAGEVQERLMPSGATLCSFRLVVRRDGAARGPSIDTLDCVAWLATVRQAVLRWTAGDLVEVRGAIRRRFWRSVSGPVSRCEIEVGVARRLARAGAGLKKVRAPVPRLAPQAPARQRAGPLSAPAGTV
jgi:single-strand DNA-binding protein